MTLRTSTTEGRNPVHVEPSRVDELPSGVPDPSTPPQRRVTAPIRVPRVDRERAVVALLERSEFTRSALIREIRCLLGCDGGAAWMAIRSLMRRASVARHPDTKRLFLTASGRFELARGRTP